MDLGVAAGLFVISFFTTLIALPKWIHRARSTGFVGRDVHKQDKREVAEMGGITVVFGVLLALLVMIAIETFYYGDGSIIELLAATLSLLIAALIGMVDDMLGWRIGLRQSEKVLLTFMVPIPIMVVNAGHAMMTFPFLGQVELGLLYPLLIVPVGIIGATNAFNMLAGYNGLEALQGIAIFSTLAYLSWEVNAFDAFLISACIVGALLAFLIFNRYPSKVFPGDVFTYFAGAGVAIVAILGNIERFAAMLFTLYYIELVLKARGRFKPEWPARVLGDGSLAVKSRIYSVPHLAITLLRKMKGKAYEYEVVATVLLFQLVIAVVTIATFKKWI